MSDADLPEAPFVVVARHRPAESDRDAAAISAQLRDTAHSLGALSAHALEALTEEGDRFVLSRWATRAGPDRYLDALARNFSGLLANTRRTELRSDPEGAEPGAFHALIMSRQGGDDG